MKPALFWTLRRHGWRSDYEPMGVTSMKGPGGNARLYGRDRFGMATNAAGRETVGRFASQEEAEYARRQVQGIAGGFDLQIKAAQRQIDQLRHDRAEAMKAEAERLSTYTEPAKAA